jgi:hypothetical protein
VGFVHVLRPHEVVDNVAEAVLVNSSDHRRGAVRASLGGPSGWQRMVG